MMYSLGCTVKLHLDQLLSTVYAVYVTEKQCALCVKSTKWSPQKLVFRI